MIPEHVREHVLDLPNVIGVGRSEKRKHELRVYVVDKVPESELEDDDIVPESFEMEGTTWTTDVIQTGKASAETSHGRDARWDRPVPAGISCGHPDVSAGTLGTPPLVAHDGDVVFVTNTHIAAPEGASLGDSILQPGPSDGGSAPDDTIGTLEDYVDIWSGDGGSTKEYTVGDISPSTTVNLGDEGLTEGEAIDPYLDTYLADDTEVVIPTGVYDWNDNAVQSDVYSNTILRGEDPSNRVELQIQTEHSMRVIADGVGFAMQNIDWTGYDSGSEGFGPEARSGAEFFVQNCRWPDGGSGSTGIFVHHGHAGTLVFEDVHVENFTDNGLYASGHADPVESGQGYGRVEVWRGYYANNDVANVRLAGDFHAEDVVSAHTTHTDGAGDWQRGFWLRDTDQSGQTGSVVNCHQYHPVDLSRSTPVIMQCRSGSETEGTIDGLYVETEENDYPAVNDRTGSDPNYWSATGIHVTGGGDTSVEAVSAACIGSGCDSPRQNPYPPLYEQTTDGGGSDEIADAALVSVDSTALRENELWDVGSVHEIHRETDYTGTFYNCGRTTGVTSGQRVARDVTIQVDHGSVTNTYHEIDEFERMTDSGDSGSVTGYFDVNDSFHATHLHFAGSDTASYGIPFDNVMRELGELEVAHPPGGLSHYQVYVDGDPDHAVSEFTSTGVTGLSPDTEYEIGVTAVSTTGFEGSAETVTATTEAEQSDVGAPDNLAVTAVGTAHVDLAWDEPANTGAGLDYYTIYVDGQPDHTVPATETVTTVDTLEPATEYLFEVTATDVNGEESASSSVTATTDEESNNTPGEPTNLSVFDASPGSLSVTWDSPAESGSAPLSHYNVYVDQTFDHRADAGTTVTTIDGLAPETSYSIGISAVNNDGFESELASVGGTTSEEQDTHSGSPIGADEPSCGFGVTVEETEDDDS